jgi:hypothetical protein
MDSTSCLYRIEISGDSGELAESMMQDQRYFRNRDWLEAHASEVFSHRGKCICIAGQQLFVADTPSEAWALASAAHPEDNGKFLRYVPVERGARIFAN